MTLRGDARFVLAADGGTLEAKDLLADDPPVICDHAELPNHLGFFLPLTGIVIVKQLPESSFDIRATSRLNRLYVELLKDDPDWGTAGRRHDMNHGVADLLFFAEDTSIFNGIGLFTSTMCFFGSGVDRLRERRPGNIYLRQSALY